MKRRILAKQLRKAHRRLAQVPRYVIDSVPDDLIIESYATCSGCGERFVDDETLERLIVEAEDSDHFIRLLNEQTCSNAA